jgi:membrane-bound serine protease (ClpP class)
MGQAAAALVIVGFLMIAAEVFIPGMVLGVLGGLCLAVAVALCYTAYGPLLGTAAFAVLAVILVAGFLLWLKFFPNTPIGKKIMLHTPPPQQPAPASDTSPGATGEAITPLRPAGTALIAGRRVDVVAESGMIEPGQKIVVVVRDGLRVVVRAVS